MPMQCLRFALGKCLASAKRKPVCCLVLVLIVGRIDNPSYAQQRSGDWPMFGGTPGRNMVNPMAKNLPADWAVEKGEKKNVKWLAQLGNKAYGGPVVANGKVFV